MNPLRPEPTSFLNDSQESSLEELLEEQFPTRADDWTRYFPPARHLHPWADAESVKSAWKTFERATADSHLADSRGRVESNKRWATMASDILRTLIRDSYVPENPLPSLKHIGGIWEKIDEVHALAEARTRLLLKQVTPPPDTDLPNWLAIELGALAHDEPDLAGAHPLAIETAIKLIGACLVSGASHEGIEISKAPLGKVSVDWTFENGRIHWIIAAAPLPWPGISVRTLTTGFSLETAVARSFHNAFDLIDDFNGHISGRDK